MPESSVTRQHVPENTLRSKLKLNDRNKDLESSTRLEVDSKQHQSVQIVKVCQPKQEINSLVHVTLPVQQEISVDEQPTSREQIYKRKQDDIIRQI